MAVAGLAASASCFLQTGNCAVVKTGSGFILNCNEIDTLVIASTSNVLLENAFCA
jgi:hypothetical protein